MTESITWFVVRGLQEETMEQCISRAEDLGRREHIEKVIIETFKGSVVHGAEIVWTQPTFELRFKLGTQPRPLRIEVGVSLHEICYDELITALSTKTRGQLEKRRFWRFFDAITEKPIHWNPPKKRTLNKKGLVSIELSTKAFLCHSRLGPGVHLLVSLDAASDVDEFMDKVPLQPRDDVTFGWQNIEAVTPLGTRLFTFHFGGAGRESARDRVRQFAKESGHSIATLDHDTIVVSGRVPEIIPASACERLLHDVLEESLKDGGCLWRQTILAYLPGRAEITRQVATVTVQPAHAANSHGRSRPA